MSAAMSCPLSAAENRGVPHKARLFIHGLDLTNKAHMSLIIYPEESASDPGTICVLRAERGRDGEQAFRVTPGEPVEKMGGTFIHG